MPPAQCPQTHHCNTGANQRLPVPVQTGELYFPSILQILHEHIWLVIPESKILSARGSGEARESSLCTSSSIIQWKVGCRISQKPGGLLEENTGRTLDDITQSKIFYDPPPRIMEIKTKVNMWDLIKLKIFHSGKETIGKVKIQLRITNTWKDAQYHSLLEKCKSKLQWDITSHWSELVT